MEHDEQYLQHCSWSCYIRTHQPTTGWVNMCIVCHHAPSLSSTLMMECNRHMLHPMLSPPTISPAQPFSLIRQSVHPTSHSVLVSTSNVQAFSISACEASAGWNIEWATSWTPHHRKDCSATLWFPKIKCSVCYEYLEVCVYFSPSLKLV